MHRLFLDCSALRRAAQPTRDTKTLRSYGSNLPWVVRRLRSESGERFSRWLRHVRSAIPEVAKVRVVVREEDRHAYLIVRYADSCEVPSWSVPDGTLRLMAQTLLLYLRVPETIYLIEEPDSGVHPAEMQEVLTAVAQVH